jgi:GT2 family glycosyltransferase
MRTAIIIPSLGSSGLEACLAGVSRLDPPPDAVVLVMSGGATTPTAATRAQVMVSGKRLGFSSAVNRGLAALDDAATDAVALLNDDAVPASHWLAALGEALEADPELAAVQGTVTDAPGERVDGRGIALDRWGLPVQIDRGAPVSDTEAASVPVAVSGTACLYRLQALRQAALEDGSIFDPNFGSYHEDLDLGLRLARLGWRCAWVPDAPVAHRGSASAHRFPWRHPWWLLANRWRALAGNLTPGAFVRATPRLLRGELRAVNTLRRDNLRVLGTAAAVAAAWPLLVAAGWRRHSPGERLAALSGSRP